MKDSVNNRYVLLKNMSKFNPIYRSHYEEFVKLVQEAFDTDKENEMYYLSIKQELKDASLDTSVEEIKTMCSIATTFRYYDIRVDWNYFIKLRDRLNAIYKELCKDCNVPESVKEVLKQLQEYRIEGYEFYWDNLTFAMFSLYCNKKYGSKKLAKSDFPAIKKELEEASKKRIQILSEPKSSSSAVIYDVNLTDNWEEFSNWAFVQFLDKGLSEELVIEKMLELGILMDNNPMQALEYSELFQLVSTLGKKNSILDIVPFVINNPGCIAYLEKDVAAALLDKVQQIFQFLTDDVIFSYTLCNVWERISTCGNKEIAEKEIAEASSFLDAHSLIPFGSCIDYDYIKRFAHG